MTTRKRCTHSRCMKMAEYARPPLCHDHFMECRIRNAQARREVREAALVRMIAAAIALLESEGYEVRKKSINERTMP